MKEKTEKYLLKYSPKKFNETFLAKAKKQNLSCSYSENGGINISPKITFVAFQPYLGPLIQLNLICSAANTTETESTLRLQRVNGITYYVQYWFSLFFVGIASTILFHKLFTNGFNDIVDYTILPIFGLAYFISIIFIARSSTNNLISKIEKVLKKEKIEYKKQ